MKILVVEDESEFRSAIESALEGDFELVLLESGEELLSKLEKHQPDVVLLDHVMPGKTGIQCVQEIRTRDEYAKIPIVMMTGISEVDEKVRALDLGVDDYLTKPFSARELSARLRAIYRRSQNSFEATQKARPGDESRRFYVGPLVIDLDAYRVSLEGKEVTLTLTEFRILEAFIKHSGIVLTREKIIELALGNVHVTDRIIDVHITSLRKKLNHINSWIQTVRGVGYRFDPNRGQA